MSQPLPAPVHHDDHGSTPAAWTTVVIITIAFVVGTLAIILNNWPMFWVGVALIVVGADRRQGHGHDGHGQGPNLRTSRTVVTARNRARRRLNRELTQC